MTSCPREMLQVDLDEILRRITDTKNIAGVVVVNSDGVTVKSTLDNSLTALVRGAFNVDTLPRPKMIMAVADPSHITVSKFKIVKC